MKKNNKHPINGDNLVDSAFLGAVLDGAPDCIFILDTEGEIKWINRYGVVLFDAASAENLVDRSHRLLWSEVGVEEAVESFQTVRGGQEVRFSSEFRRLNGTPQCCDVIYKPVSNNGNEVQYIIGSARLVSAELEEKHVEHYSRQLRGINEELRRKSEHLNEIDKMKSDFLNIVSHELGTPLTSLKWSADNIAILLKDHDNANIQRLLNILRKDSERLNNLVGELLDFSRIEAGKLTLRRKIVDIETIIRNCVAESIKNIENKNLKLEVDIPSDLPKVWIDKLKIKSVLKNLLDNSIKFTGNGGKIKIEAAPQGPRNTILVSVEDTGIGIPEDNFEKIFEKFYRSNPSANASSRGTGLGLSIAKSFVEQHGCKIWCESVFGKGSTFYFTLPAESDTE